MAAHRNKSQKLRPGDKIAVVAPSGPVDPVALAAGVAILRAAGFVVETPSTRPVWRIFSGTDAQRLAELQEALDAPDVRAVWVARGGYGLNRILSGLHLPANPENAKLVIGFSDASALLCQIEASGQGTAIHGPMVAHDLGRESAEGGWAHLLEILSGRKDWTIPVPKVLQAGAAIGPVRGGCLTVLASLLGTAAAPSFAGSIALLEDQHEAPRRRLDRLLVQLRQSGALDGVRGILFGGMEGCGPPDEVCETITDCLGDLSVPIGFDAPVGHGPSNRALPLGFEAELRLTDQGAGVLVGREAAVWG